MYCAPSMCQAMCEPPNNTEFMPFHSSVCRENNEQPWCEVKIGREVPWYSLTISIPLFASHGVGIDTNFSIMPHVKRDALGSQTGSVAPEVWFKPLFTMDLSKSLKCVVSSTMFYKWGKLGLQRCQGTGLKSYGWSLNHKSVFLLSLSYQSQLLCPGVSDG